MCRSARGSYIAKSIFGKPVLVAHFGTFLKRTVDGLVAPQPRTDSFMPQLLCCIIIVAGLA
jgi:hypothetical protein